jgi:PAS domain S-box-containing protein
MFRKQKSRSDKGREQKPKDAHSIQETSNEAMLERITDAFISLDTQDTILYLNNKAATLLHRTQTELIGSNIWEAFPEAVGTVFFQKFPEAMKTQQTTTWEGYFEPLQTWFEVRAFPSSDGLSAYFNDITTRKRAELQREELARRKDRFISMAGHELKNPLTSARGFTQILQKRPTIAEDEVAMYCLERVESQLYRLTRLIDDLLDISKMQTGELALVRADFDLHALLQEVVTDLQATNKTLTISLTHQYPSTQVYGDRDRIEQIIVNLLHNAVKYSSEEPVVIVRTIVEHDQVRVEVEDSGSGIAPDEQEKIFERFYQVQENSGLGIGLYIAREIITQHEGKMGVISSEGQGAIFWFTLPIKNAGQ